MFRENLNSIGSAVLEIRLYQKSRWWKHPFFQDFLWNAYKKTETSIFFKMVCDKIYNTVPSTTFIKSSNIWRPQLRRFGGGLFRLAHILHTLHIPWAAQGQCFRGSNNFLSSLQVFLGEAIVRIILLIYCSSPYE
jgi:hypothetical protein